MQTNYQKLLGSPERAAGTLEEICRACPASVSGEICDETCPLYVPGFIFDGEPSEFVEWLESEAAE